jgi:hypothetical protein
VGQERSAPGGFSIAGRAVHDLRRQTPDGTALAIYQPGLPGKPLALVDHSHYVPIASTQAPRCEDGQMAVLAVNVCKVTTQTAGRNPSVELCLDHDLSADDV